MNFYNAIRILELDSNFTEESLKKAYRRLALKYHPDLYQDEKEQEEAKRKIQEINEAREFLEKETKKKHKFTKEQIKEQYKNKLRNYSATIPSYAPNYFLKADENIKIHIYNGLTKISKIPNFIMTIYPGYINKVFQKFEKLINQELKTASETYKTENKLDIKESDIADVQNIFELYNTLNHLKEQRNHALKAKIDSKTADFEFYSGYETLKSKIVELKNQALTSLINGNQNIFIELKQQIEHLFQQYYQDLNNLNNLKRITKNMNNPKIKEYLIKYEQNITNQEICSTITKNIYQIIQEQREIIAEEQATLPNHQTLNLINELEYNVLNNIKKMMQKYFKKQDKDNIEYLNVCLKNINDAISKARKGIISYGALRLLYKLNFTNANDDMYIFLAVKYNLREINRDRINRMILDESINNYKFDTENSMENPATNYKTLETPTIKH